MPTMTPTDFKKRLRKDGTVRVWDIPDKQWKIVAQVDAREMIERKTADLYGPSVKMTNGQGQKIQVCEVEVPTYEGNGYKVDKDQERNPLPDDPAHEPENSDNEPGEGDGESDDDETPVAWLKFKLDELREFAMEAEVEGDINEMTKKELADALDAAGYKPKD